MGIALYSVDRAESRVLGLKKTSAIPRASKQRFRRCKGEKKPCQSPMDREGTV
jgi:hypothetical protein